MRRGAAPTHEPRNASAERALASRRAKEAVRVVWRMGKAPRKVHRGEIDAESLPGAAVRRRAAQASMGGRLAIPANKSSLLTALSSANRVDCGSRRLHL